MPNKYYNYNAPKLPETSFSDVVEQQIQLIEKRKAQEAQEQMQIAAQQRKIQDSQAEKLYGFKVEDLSELDRNVFNAKKQWMKDRIDSYYYSGSNRDEFMQDVTTLTTRFDELKAHSDNTKAEKAKLEGWVSGTQQWTDQTQELKDDLNSFNLKMSNWEKGGVDPSTIQIDPATGDAYGNYTDINGNPLLDEQGNPQYGLVHQSPTRGSKEYFTPTTAPYANLLPGKFSKEFSAATTRLKNNPNLSYEEKVQQLQTWVTSTANQNQAVQATALQVFNQNYGPAAQAAMQEDAKADPGDGSFVPIQMREYVDETMKFLIGNLQETKSSSGSGSGAGDKPLTSFVTFNAQDFLATQTGPQQPDSSFGAGITNLLVPSTGVGGPGLMVPRSHVAVAGDDPRANEVSDQYKVLAVAIDEGKNLFVNAEMYMELTDEEVALDPELQARRNNLLAMGMSTDAAKVSRKKRTVPIIVSPTMEKDGRIVRNPEYLTILAKIALAKGFKIDDQLDAAAKGMDILEDFNDEQAQIAASLPQQQQ
jgi:hypothetical protein